jgi:holo-[acyl-carrier protein] synthase
VAVGIDLLEVDRVERAVERWGERFLDRCFTVGERQAAERGNMAEALAARYAAKEAVSKCLGTGFKYGVRRQDIEVVGNERGAPSIRLHGTAAELAGEAVFLVSLTHTRGLAGAVALMQEPGE